MTRGQAMLARQQLSQKHAVAEKRKTANSALKVQAKMSLDVSQVLLGKAAKVGAYIGARHDTSPKGKPIHGDIQAPLESVYEGELADCEAAALEAMPKYNVGPNFPEGRNLSKASMTPKQALKWALKYQLPGQIDWARGQRLSDHAVNMVNFFRGELQNQFPAGPPPTNEQILNTIQLSLFEAFDGNLTRAQGHRRPVRK